MLKFLLALDGSEPTWHAIEAVAKLSRSSAPLEVFLINVRTDPDYYNKITPTTYQELDAVARAEQARVLNEAANQARAVGLNVAATLNPSGGVVSEILRAAAQGQVDQIVLGTCRMGAMGGLIMGSVAQCVVDQARVPVLLVK